MYVLFYATKIYEVIKRINDALKIDVNVCY